VPTDDRDDIGTLRDEVEPRSDTRFRRFENGVSLIVLLFLGVLPIAEIIVRTVFRAGIKDAALYVQQFVLLVGFLGGMLAARENAHLSVAESHPAWLIQEWLTIWDKSKVESLCKFNNTHAAVSLRYRTGLSDIEPLLNTFNISYTVDERLPHCLQLEAGSQIKPELFGHGELVAQDPAAMLAASITGAKPGDTIWDICAAPGGKTFYMADQMKNQGKILATDKSEVRLQRLIEQQKQLNITCIETLKMDAVNDSLPLDFTEFDAILVDAPCTGWGTFRKHPDLRWRLHPGDSKRLGLLSLQMLEQVKLKVRNGGVLVYSTCTLSPNENEGVVEKFLAKNPNFEIEPVDALIPALFREAITPQGFLTLFPPLWNLDGAFAARLKKKP